MKFRKETSKSTIEDLQYISKELKKYDIGESAQLENSVNDLTESELSFEDYENILEQIQYDYFDTLTEYINDEYEASCPRGK